MQVHADGPRGQSCGRGNLRAGHSLNQAERQRFAIGIRQLANDGENRVGVRSIAVAGGQVLREGVERRAAAQVIHGSVAGNGREPPAEGRGVLQRRQLAERQEKDVVDDVVDLEPFDAGERDAVHHGCVAGVQRRERGTVALLCGRHERDPLGVSGLGVERRQRVRFHVDTPLPSEDTTTAATTFRPPQALAGHGRHRCCGDQRIRIAVYTMSEFVDRLRAFALAMGAPGLFVVAFLDSSFLSLPEINDLLLVFMVTQHKERMVLYAATATLGSLAGCLVLYYIGRKGDQWVARRFSPARVERAMATFRRYGVMAVLIPSLLPPPAPFKVFVLLAGVAGISMSRFAIAILIGRGLRYFIEGYLALKYGDQAMDFMRENSKPVGLAVVALLLVGLAAWVLVKRSRQPKRL